MHENKVGTEQSCAIHEDIDQSGYIVERSCLFSSLCSREEVGVCACLAVGVCACLAVAESLVVFIQSRMTGVWSSHGGRGYGVCPPATDMIFPVLGSITLPKSSVSVKRRFLECLA